MKHLPEVKPDRSLLRITINRRDFTPEALVQLVTVRPGESVEDLARRLAGGLGLGCVITRRFSED